jgi:hypothetical protein
VLSQLSYTPVAGKISASHLQSSCLESGKKRSATDAVSVALR